MRIRMLAVLASLVVALASSLALAAEAGTPPTLIDCEMRFSLKGWSAFYKTAKGTGKITCDNGQTANVAIKVTAGGVTFGKTEILNAKGEFSRVKSMDDLFGGYAQAEAHAGVVKSGTAQVLTKGEVSLALAGSGAGVDIGLNFGKFTITKK